MFNSTIYENLNSGKQEDCYDSPIEFTSCWADQSVEREILRGHLLRQSKLYECQRRECDVINIESPRNVKNKTYARKKKHESNTYFNLCGGSSTPPRLDLRTKYRKQKKIRSPCGLRIAQLAVPTKRQCIDSLRNNYDKLPAHMVERLRQYVLDQRPLVAVSDAIQCFKQQKCYKKKKSGRNSEKPFARLRKPLRKNDVKILCAIFGHNIAKKLSKPREIILNDELQKIANVVSSDILKLMYKSNNGDVENKINKAIHIDIVKKITIWVSDILMETAIKILEEQYKDFEEEVGPVLDIIDDLVALVLDICEPKRSILEESESSSPESKSLRGLEENPTLAVFHGENEENMDHHVQNELFSIIDTIFRDEGIDMRSEYDEMEDITEKTQLKSKTDVFSMNVETEGPFFNQERDENSIANYLKNEIISTINDIIDHRSLEKRINSDEPKIFKENTTSDPNKYFVNVENNELISEKEVKEESSVEGHLQIELISLIDNLFQNHGMRSDSNEVGDLEQKSNLWTGSGIHMDVKNYNNLLQSDYVDTNDDFKDALEINDHEEGATSEITNDSNKKVKFNEGNEKAKTVTSNSLGGEELSDKRSIEFSPPNEDLLSDADESWPEEIQLPLIKPSASASRSITSLGKIIEDDEKTILGEDESLERAVSNVQDKINFHTAETEHRTLQDNSVVFEEEIQPTREYIIPSDLHLVQPILTTDVERRESFIGREKNNFSTLKENRIPEIKGISGKGEEIMPRQVEIVGKQGTKIKSGTICQQEDTKQIKHEILLELPSTDSKHAKERKKSTQNTSTIQGRFSLTLVNKFNNSAEATKRKTPQLCTDNTKTVTVNTIRKISNNLNKKKERIKCKTIDGTVGAAQSVKDFTEQEDKETAKDIKFSSLRVKPKRGYTSYKKNYNDIIKWCRDLEKGYENLRLWNEWINTTSQTISELRYEISTIHAESRHNIMPVLLGLKTNINKDAGLWRKVRQNTREILKSYRKTYQTQNMRMN